MDAIVSRVDVRALLFQLFVHSSIGPIQRFEVEVASADTGLVANDDDFDTRPVEPTDAFGSTRQKGNFIGIGQVIHVNDDGSVAVESDQESHLWQEMI